MSRAKRLSEDQERFLCFQYIGGKTIPELAKEWNIAIGTVFKILRRHHISRREIHLTKMK